MKEHFQPEYFINREFTSLSFNERVLSLSENEDIPILERMRFLCIYANNIDEFFEIRVGGLKEKMFMHISRNYIDGLSTEEIFNELSERAHTLTDKMYDIFNKQLIPNLAKEGVNFLEAKDWNEDIHLFAKHYFKNEILPIVSPIALDLAHPFPRLFNKSLNFIVSLKGKDAFERNINYAIIHTPKSLPRIIPVPSELSENNTQFIYLSSIILTHVHRLFPGMDIEGCYPFRLTRNSDLFLREEEIDDLASAVQRELFSRHYGRVVRLEIAKSCPKHIVDFILQKHHLKHNDAYYCDGPVNIQRFIHTINKIIRPSLCYPVFTPYYPLTNHTKKNIFAKLDDHDILLHHPYESFDVVINFVRQAASDPAVLAIKQTLYRTQSNSTMVDALVEAARLGKEVTAIIELRARFDEESNLLLANRLHEAGVLVLYGVVGYKTHAKMTLIVKRTGGKLKRYVHLGTGNYHEKTAQRYTDLGLLTSDPTIGQDVDIIFQQLTGLGKVVKLKALSHAPFTLQQRLLTLIDECIHAAKKQKKSKIFFKMNGLTDRIMIEALYRASKAGVQITLIVRSVCCLKPKIPGISDNIRVFSILGRFLEHHRVFYVQIDKEEWWYLSSADLMERNLYNRIEVMFPVLDPSLQKRIKEEIIENYLKDNEFCWEMQADGTYQQVTKGKYSAQEFLLEKYQAINLKP